IERENEFLFDLLRIDNRTEANRFIEIALVQRADVMPNPFILHATCYTQLYEVVVEYRIEAGGSCAFARETAHPDSITDQQVIEGAVQRLEESAAIGTVVRVRDLSSGIVEALVAPGVVTGEHMVAGKHAMLLR